MISVSLREEIQMGYFRQNVAIDLGSSNIYIGVEKKDIVIKEPSVVALKESTGEVVAVGKNAKEMVGKTDADISTIRPVQGGVISEYTVTMNMLSYFLDKAIRNPIKRIFRPDVITVIPCEITNVERRAAERALKEAGAGRIFFVEAPLAAAIGAQVDVSAPSGKMVVDIGGGVTDIAVISFDGIVASSSVAVGGNNFDEAIKNYFKKEYKMILGDATAEKIKINHACAYRDVRVQPFEVSATDLQSRLPVEKTVKPDELIRPLSEVILPILDSVRTVLEKTPPELASDIFERGILLTGGGALLAGLDTLISKATGINVLVADHAQECVARGALKIIQSMSSERKNTMMAH